MKALPKILLGAGGHAKVLLDVLDLNKQEVIGALTPDRQLWGGKINETPVLGGDDQIERYSPGEIELVNGIGTVGNLEKRIETFEKFKNKGFHFASAIHPSAIISKNVFMGEGVQVMAGCVIQPGCKILENTIINTSVSVDHDCHIGTNCHLAPGVTLSGQVDIGDGTYVGTNATIIQGTSMGSECFIAAGSVVVSDIEDNIKVKGVPAKSY